jgi:hypothetical protein
MNVARPVYETDVAYRVVPFDEYEEGVLLFSMYYMPDPASVGLRNNPFVINAEGLAHIGFGVDFLLKHCEDETKRKHFLTWLVRVNHWVDYSERDTPEDDSICTYFFDLLKPLGPQITQARATLKGLQMQRYPDFEQFKKRTQNWPRHLRVIDAKDQGSTHQEIYDHIVDELACDDEDLKDDFYRPIKTEKLKDQESGPKAKVSQWHKQAVGVMEKAALLL